MEDRSMAQKLYTRRTLPYDVSSFPHDNNWEGKARFVTEALDPSRRIIWPSSEIGSGRICLVQSLSGLLIWYHW